MRVKDLIRVGKDHSRLQQWEYDEKRRKMFEKGDYWNWQPTHRFPQSNVTDIVTGIPPKFKPDAMDKWRKERDQEAIERLFR